MARKTKKEAQETREAILDAAARVFVKQGVSQASLEAIATQAGVTRGAVYWHFKNKVDIFKALQDQLHTPLIDTILADIERDHPHPLKQLEALCVKLLVEVETHPQKKRVLTIFFQKCDYSGDMAPLLKMQNENKAKGLDLFIHYFKRAIEKGHLPDNADPRTMTIALHCYLSGICREYLNNAQLFTMKEQAAALMQLFFRNFSQA